MAFLVLFLMVVALSCVQAVLGPSGAGKSTLLDILSQHKTLGSVSGEVLLHGKPVGKRYRQLTAYVPQVS